VAHAGGSAASHGDVVDVHNLWRTKPHRDPRRTWLAHTHAHLEAILSMTRLSFCAAEGDKW